LNTRFFAAAGEVDPHGGLAIPVVRPVVRKARQPAIRLTMRAIQFIITKAEGAPGRCRLKPGTYQLGVTSGGDHQAGDGWMLLDLAAELLQQRPYVSTRKYSPRRGGRWPWPAVLQAPENQVGLI